MFIGGLSASQQVAFLAMAKKIIAADGVVDERETEILDTLTAQCDESVSRQELEATAFDQSLFPDHASRVACLLELVGVALADEDYDVTEKEYIAGLAKSFGISRPLLEDIENWVSRQMTLVHEAKQMMMEG